MKKNTETSDVYVRLDSANAIEAKKNILEMAESVITMQMISEKVKRLNKTELAGRNASRKQLKMMISEINHMLNHLPKVKIEKSRAKEESTDESKEFSLKKIEKKTLNQELDDIKRRIQSLSK